MTFIGRMKGAIVASFFYIRGCYFKERQMKHEEEDIIDLLKKGNVACVKMLFDNYYRALCVFALRFLNSFEDAEDVAKALPHMARQ